MDMDMYVWLTLLVAVLCVLPSVLRTLCPYLIQDCAYILHAARFGLRLELYKRRARFYSILDGFLDGVRKHPHKPFIHFMGETHSYSDVDRESNKVARALQKVAGLKEGDIVALFLGNEPCFIWVWLGLAKLGCATALLNFNIRSKSLLHCFSCCGANVLIVDQGKSFIQCNQYSMCQCTVFTAVVLQLVSVCVGNHKQHHVSCEFLVIPLQEKKKTMTKQASTFQRKIHKQGMGMLLLIFLANDHLLYMR